MAYSRYEQYQVDLAHQLVAQAELVLRLAHFLQGAEVHLADRGDQRVEATGLLEQGANGVRVADVDLEIAAAVAYPDDLVALAEFFVDALAKGAAGADQDDFHTGLSLREGEWFPV